MKLKKVMVLLLSVTLLSSTCMTNPGMGFAAAAEKAGGEIQL